MADDQYHGSLTEIRQFIRSCLIESMITRGMGFPGQLWKVAKELDPLVDTAIKSALDEMCELDMKSINLSHVDIRQKNNWGGVSLSTDMGKIKLMCSSARGNIPTKDHAQRIIEKIRDKLEDVIPDQNMFYVTDPRVRRIGKSDNEGFYMSLVINISPTYVHDYSPRSQRHSTKIDKTKIFEEMKETLYDKLGATTTRWRDNGYQYGSDFTYRVTDIKKKTTTKNDMIISMPKCLHLSSLSQSFNDMISDIESFACRDRFMEISVKKLPSDEGDNDWITYTVSAKTNDEMIEKYLVDKVGSVDWRPAETIPEDYYGS